MPALVDDPQLLSEILRELRVKGQLAPFTISETAIAVFDIGKLTDLDVQHVTTPDSATGVRIGTANATTAVTREAVPYSFGAVHGDGVTNNPGAGTVLADTGALAAGRISLLARISTDAARDQFVLEHRNAANTANLATMSIIVQSWAYDFTYIVAANERFRLVNTNAIVGDVAHTIITTNYDQAVA